MRKYILRLLKGWFGEKKTAFNMWVSLNANVYQRIHDLILPAKNGTTQIDHLLVSPYGLFIIETKNIKGWIFGSEDQSKWTQSLFGKKYSFQNPVRQIYRQKKVLSEFLGLSESLIHTIVFFVGDCEFKTTLPSNVIKSGLGSYIKQYKIQSLSPEDIKSIFKKIDKHASESTLTIKDHIQSLRERHHSSTVCPKCGSKLVERIARKGLKAGSKFLGCENYPKCRFTKNA
ncbi:hypothetical protein MNBD_GAMMA12-1822 [hydrothermal vent metagenome]|uniref:NERD domain-containing protein n=1 Tax=hydrothermal vent metagenome TaxID=652676 RepID=A0A3B0Y671_9ZZZZ